MAAGNWILYNDFKLNILKKLMDLSMDTFKVALLQSTSNGIAAALTPATYATLTNEVANGNGYTTGGASAGSPTLTGGGAVSTITWDTADVAWTATGGPIVARAAVIYDFTAAAKNLVAYCLLDSTPADVTVPDGVTETVQISNVFSAS